MVLAAGYGARLKPLTLERAKPAIPLLGKPLIVTIIEKLGDLGVTGFRINLHTLPETVKEVLGAKTEYISFSHEPQILGTAGGLKANESFLTDDTFIMINGDIYFEFDIRGAIDFHLRNNPLVTMVIYPQNLPYKYTPIQIDMDYRIHSLSRGGQFVQTNAQTYVFTGIAILSRKIFDLIPPNRFSDMVTDVYEPAIASGYRICGYPVEGYWNDLGVPSRYLSTQMEVFRKRRMNPSVFMADTTLVSEPQKIGSYVSIGARTIVEEDCDIRDSILWEDCHVRRGSKIRRCILGQGVSLKGQFKNQVITLNGEKSLD